VKMNKKGKVLIGLFLVVLAFSMGVLVYNMGRDQLADLYDTVLVERGDIEVWVETSGNLEPSSRHEVRIPLTGVLEQLKVTSGQTVAPGDKLAEVSYEDVGPDIEKLELQEMMLEQDIEALSNEVTSEKVLSPRSGQVNWQVEPGDRVQLGEIVAYIESFFSSQGIRAPITGIVEHMYFEQGETCRTDEVLFEVSNEQRRNELEQQIAAAELKLKEVHTDLSTLQELREVQEANAFLYSPVRGLVTFTNPSLGRGDRLSEGDLFATIADHARLISVVAVPETEINLIAVDQVAKVSVGALQGETVDAVVRAISSVGLEREGIPFFDVTVELAYHEDLKPGMRGTTHILVEASRNTLTIPLKALIEQDGDYFVRIPDEDERDGYVLLQVSTGLKNGERVEILDGLDEAQEILIPKDAQRS